MRVVLDTSVIVAAVLQPEGVAAALVQLVLADPSPVQTCMSLPLALEYCDVLSRPDIIAQTPMSPGEIDNLVVALQSVATRVDIVISVRPCAPDPGDDFVVELVVNAKAHRLVTYNTRDFVGPATQWGFVVCTPGALLAELKED